MRIDDGRLPERGWGFVRDPLTLPKAHLHLHLEGSARPATIEELAARAGVDYHVPTSFSNFPEFNDAYLAMTMFIQRPEDLIRICAEIIADDASQGVRYSEPEFVPGFYAERFGMTELEVFCLIRDAFQAAGREHGVEVGCMICGLWPLPIAEAEAAARFAAANRDEGVVAFGFASIEPVRDYRRWRRARDIAYAAGLLVIPHVGEFTPAASVREVIDELRPDRIAHGVRAIEDQTVVALLAERGITCDVALTSNIVLGVFPELATHPLPQLIEAGVPVTLNADDSLFFGSLVGEEYRIARDTFGLSDEQLAAIARTSVDASGAPAETKARIHAGIDQWLSGD
jgi:adenosine deaminase